MSFTRQIICRASIDRLELLIEERLQPDSNREPIDQRIWNLFGERWAVLYTDLSGFSRRVAEFGMIHFLQTIYASHRLLALHPGLCSSAHNTRDRFMCDPAHKTSRFWFMLRVCAEPVAVDAPV